MGRLSKKKRDRIRKMIKEGYTTKEIVSEVGSSTSTISRIRKEFNENIQQGKESSIEYALLKSLYQMYLGFELNYNKLEQEKFLTYFRNCVIDLTKNILEADDEMAKKVLFESEFFDHIMGFLEFRPEQLNENDQLYRQKWIKILKKWHPEKLAKLM